MIIYMCDMSKCIAVTNRTLCTGNYLHQIQKVVSMRPNALILREKGLQEDEYEALAAEVMKLCHLAEVPCYIHTHRSIAENLRCPNLHLSMKDFLNDPNSLQSFDRISVSCHSLEEAKTAERLGATQIVLGTILETECKKGLPGKGIAFLREVCEQIRVPVFAIGGIKPDNIRQMLDAGAAGGCMMSWFMNR
ncbi:MAG: thiamine phosphate synthase [Lachnospiraceae bacterium]